MLYEVASGVIVVSSGMRVGVQEGLDGFQSLPMFLTVDETSELLRTTTKAVYTMIDRGQLPGVTRIGRRLLIRRDDLLAWLDESRAPSLKE